MRERGRKGRDKRKQHSGSVGWRGSDKKCRSPVGHTSGKGKKSLGTKQGLLGIATGPRDGADTGENREPGRPSSAEAPGRPRKPDGWRSIVSKGAVTSLALKLLKSLESAGEAGNAQSSLTRGQVAGPRTGRANEGVLGWKLREESGQGQQDSAQQQGKGAGQSPRGMRGGLGRPLARSQFGSLGVGQ